MPIVKWNGHIDTPWMENDVDDGNDRQWTDQPDKGGVLCSSVTGPVNKPKAFVESAKAAERDEPVRLVDLGTKHAKLTLRDYQKDAIAALTKSWNDGNSAPLVVLPTGSGKSLIAAYAMNSMVKGSRKKCLFLAHRKELLEQTAATIRLVDFQTTVGIVQADKRNIGKDITLASIQTIGHRSRRRLDEVLAAGPYDLIVCDEAHHAVSPQWTRVLDALREQNTQALIFGMTATPGRADGTALDRVFDDVCFHRSLHDMISGGWLVPPKGFKVTLDIDFGDVDSRNGDFVQTQLAKVMNTAAVNQAVVDAWCQYAHDRKTIVFAVDVAHARALTEVFKDAGYVAEAVDGKMKKKERADVLNRFRSGAIKLLVNCEVASEGFDDPSTEVILQARPTQSHGLFIQCVGRGLRLFPGKTECIVIDCVGNGDRHSLVQLATLSGFDPERGAGNGGGEDNGDDGEGADIDETPEVIDASIRGEEVELTRRPQRTRYQWREASVGWILQIPRIGYYLVAWSKGVGSQCTIRFFDQRPGKRDELPRTIIGSPIEFEMAYGMVEAECDRIFSASGRRKGAMFHSPEDHGESPPDVQFVDINDGLDEDTVIPEEYVLKDAAWREKKVSSRQLAVLKRLGAKEKTMPSLAGEASDLITILQAEKDAKMRLPPTPKQIGYLRVNGLGHARTKGEAGRLIWQHRKATGR